MITFLTSFRVGLQPSMIVKPFLSVLGGILPA